MCKHVQCDVNSAIWPHIVLYDNTGYIFIDRRKLVARVMVEGTAQDLYEGSHSNNDYDESLLMHNICRDTIAVSLQKIPLQRLPTPQVSPDLRPYRRDPHAREEAAVKVLSEERQRRTN